jgi:2-haloacid dehalogenase
MNTMPANDSTKAQAIVFDAYGTLFSVNSINQALESQFGKQASQIATTWRQKQLEYTWLRT